MAESKKKESRKRKVNLKPHKIKKAIKIKKA